MTSARIASKGLIKSGGPIDWLVCVADADRASEVCGVEAPPAAPASTSAWVERANEAWTETLRSAVNLAPKRISGRFLRWSHESLLIAGHDRERVLRKLGCRDLESAARFLQGCSPRPAEIADPHFVDRFRKASHCLNELMRTAGATPSRKGSASRADALDEASSAMMGPLRERVPDLASLVAHVIDRAGAGA